MGLFNKKPKESAYLKEAKKREAQLRKELDDFDKDIFMATKEAYDLFGRGRKGYVTNVIERDLHDSFKHNIDFIVRADKFSYPDHPDKTNITRMEGELSLLVYYMNMGVKWMYLTEDTAVNGSIDYVKKDNYLGLHEEFPRIPFPKEELKAFEGKSFIDSYFFLVKWVIDRIDMNYLYSMENWVFFMGYKVCEMVLEEYQKLEKKYGSKIHEISNLEKRSIMNLKILNPFTDKKLDTDEDTMVSMYDFIVGNPEKYKDSELPLVFDITPRDYNLSTEEDKFYWRRFHIFRMTFGLNAPMIGFHKKPTGVIAFLIPDYKECAD